MILEDFRFLNNEPIDNPIIKRDYSQIYHQQRAQLNQSDQNVQFNFGEKNIYHQLENGYQEFDITVRKSDSTNFHYDDPRRSVKNGFAFCFKEARLSTTTGSYIEHNKFCSQVSTIMKVISEKDGDFYLNLIILTKMIFQFLKNLLIYHPQLNPNHNKKC